MPEPRYEQTSRGFAFFFGGDAPLYCSTEVAILFDVRDGILLKHGTPETVGAAYRTMRERYIASGFEDVANDLVMLQGSFDVVELNQVIQEPEYIGAFYRALLQAA